MREYTTANLFWKEKNKKRYARASLIWKSRKKPSILLFFTKIVLKKSIKKGIYYCKFVLKALKIQNIRRYTSGTYAIIQDFFL